MSSDASEIYTYKIQVLILLPLMLGEGLISHFNTKDVFETSDPARNE